MFEVYIIFLCVCLLICLLEWRQRSVKYLFVLIALSIITEKVGASFGKHNKKLFETYTIFSFFEYPLITLILRENLRSPIMRNLMVRSIPVFTVAALVIFMNTPDKGSNFNYPTTIGQLEGVWVMTWCMLSLLSIEPGEHTSIHHHPEFWFALGFYIYNAGTICFNGVYNLLMKTNTGKAIKLFEYINLSFNYLLYVSLAFGILAFRWKKKYSVPY